jgi:hypothetical protein
VTGWGYPIIAHLYFLPVENVTEKQLLSYSLLHISAILILAFPRNMGVVLSPIRIFLSAVSPPITTFQFRSVS